MNFIFNSRVFKFLQNKNHLRAAMLCAAWSDFLAIDFGGKSLSTDNKEYKRHCMQCCPSELPVIEMTYKGHSRSEEVTAYDTDRSHTISESSIVTSLQLCMSMRDKCVGYK